MLSGLIRLLAIGAIAVFLGFPAPASAAVAEDATVTDTANVRGRPNTESAILAELPVGTPVSVDCWANGENVDGTTMWLHLGAGGWIYSTLVTPVDVPQCDASTASTTETQYTGKIGVGGSAEVEGGDDDGDGDRNRTYENCDDAPGPVPLGAPGYGPHLDSDNDGVGCEIE